MLQVCYVLIQMIEILLNAWILHSLFPEPRKNSKWIYGIEVASYLILGLSYAWNGWDSFISNISVLFHAITFSVICCSFLKENFLKVFPVEMLYMISVSFLKLPVLILECIVLNEPISKMNRGNRTIPECIWCSILILVILSAAKKRKVSEYIKKYINRLTTKNAGLMLIVTGIQWFLLSYNMRLGKQGFHMLDFIFSVVFIFGFFLCLHYLVLRIAYHEIQLDKERLDISQELLQKQNSEFHEMYKKNCERVHESRHMLEYLYYCVKEAKYEEMEAFLGKNLDELKEENRPVWTGLPFLDFIINYKKQAMDKQDIVFQLELDVYEYPFEEAELGILLGNLLDNAIEACEKCKSEKRKIYLKIWNFKYLFMLKLVNSSSKIPILAERRFITDKADRNAHGMGVEQVKRIVKKYGGDISFQYSKEHFETEIIISTMKEKENE